MSILLLSIGTQRNHLDEIIPLYTQTEIIGISVMDMREENAKCRDQGFGWIKQSDQIIQ